MSVGRAGGLRPRLLEREQLRGADFKRAGEGADVLEGGVADAALDARQVSHVQPGAVRHLFLRSAQLVAQAPHLSAEGFLVCVHLTGR